LPCGIFPHPNWSLFQRTELLRTEKKMNCVD
jgi:hypothetical protein